MGLLEPDSDSAPTLFLLTINGEGGGEKVNLVVTLFLLSSEIEKASSEDDESGDKAVEDGESGDKAVEDGGERWAED